ncbi:MAG: hypothetical protein SNJ59_02230 [Aggregatilineales bacterium]
MPERRQPPSSPPDATLPARPRQPAQRADPALPPPALRAFLDKGIDLDALLNARYPSMPLMTVIYVYDRLALTTTQDGAAGFQIEIDPYNGDATFFFTLGSALGMRFTPHRLTTLDRSTWLQRMRCANKTPVFLWGATRHQHDYLIFVRQRHFTNVYAFSPANIEAAARLSHDVMTTLLDWFSAYWPPHSDSDASAAANW